MRRGGGRAAARVFIAGAGGFGRTVHEYLLDRIDAGARLRVGGFLDDRPGALDGFDLGVVPSRIEAHTPAATDLHLVAVGAPEARRALAGRLRDRGARLGTLVHPSAYVARSARIAEGCIVGPFAYVGAFAELGENAVVGAHAFIDHDAAVGRFSHVGPHVLVGAQGRVDELTWLRAGGSRGPGSR